MELILDANILFSALIKNSVTASLIVRDDVILFTPEFVFEEFEKYESDILNKTKRNTADFQRFIRILESKIQLIAKEEVKKHMKYARKICPDPNDVPYFACALAKNCFIWSNDKKLKEQSVITIINTAELFRKLSE